MKALQLLTILLFYFQGMAQMPEKVALWPEDPPESNGLEGKEIINEKGEVANSCRAELTVYRPEPDKNKGMAVVICPGGGYFHLAMNHEGEMFARWLNERGITALVLKYRMPNGHHRVPIADARQALRWVRSKAGEWGIDPARIGIAGFSAGGHLASTVATHSGSGNTEAAGVLEAYSSRPDFVLLFYPVISMKEELTHAGSRYALLGAAPSPARVEEYSGELQVGAQTPPVFLLHCDDDIVVSPLNSILFYRALKKNKVPAALYIFPKGGHGWGLDPAFEYYPEWTALLEKWLGAI